MNLDAFIIYLTSFFGLFTLIYFYMTLYENKHNILSPEPKVFPKVTVLVPAYNEEKTIEKTLNSLLELNYPKDKLEIIVIDDGSIDRTFDIAKTYFSKGVKAFKTEENMGKGKALNFGLTKASGEFVGALDADSHVDSESLRRIVGFFENPKVMAVTPSMKVWMPKGFLQKIQQVEFLIGIFLRKVFAFMDCVHVTPGPFTIYRKLFFDKYGGYDHTTITEDIEVALRIQSLNYVIENSVDAYVYTKGPAKFKALFYQRLRWYRGFMDNAVRYKRLFSIEYGLLGVFILPISFISVFFVVLSLFYVMFKQVIKVSKFAVNLYNINFDIWKIFHFNFDWFNINLAPAVILGLFTFAAGIFMIVTAKNLSDEKNSIKFSYFWYMVFYWALFGLWWTVAIYYKITNKKIKWAGRWL